MKTWIRRTLIGIAGAGVLLGGVAAYSHRMHGGHAWHAMGDSDPAAFRAHMIERVGGHLELDESQKARLGVVADRLGEQHQALHGATDPRAELQALVAGPTFDRNKATTLLFEKTDALRAGGPAVIAALADFYDSLTPAQQTEVRTLTTSRRHRWGHRP